MRLPALFLAAALWLSACAAPGDADILLYDGTGASPNDVKALERLMSSNGLAYETADTAAFNAMTGDELKNYRLLIIPGGNFETMGKALTPAASETIREAVRDGVNYLGVCAGGFFAGASPYNGLNLADGKRFGFYSASAQGVRKTAVTLSIAGFASADHYWEDGPEFSGWGEVIAKYPDGAPAIVQGEAGEGFVILTGVHPEAPHNWRTGMTFSTPVSADNAYAITLIEAALNGTRLPHF